MKREKVMSNIWDNIPVYADLSKMRELYSQACQYINRAHTPDEQVYEQYKSIAKSVLNANVIGPNVLFSVFLSLIPSVIVITVIIFYLHSVNIQVSLKSIIMMALVIMFVIALPRYLFLKKRYLKSIKKWQYK